MFRQICNPPKFTIRICNPLKPHIYKMMYAGERIANPHLETAGLQIWQNKWALLQRRWIGRIRLIRQIGLIGQISIISR